MYGSSIIRGLSHYVVLQNDCEDAMKIGSHLENLEIWPLVEFSAGLAAVSKRLYDLALQRCIPIDGRHLGSRSTL